MKRLGLRTHALLLAILPALLLAVMLAGYMVHRVSADAERELRTYGKGLSRQLAAVSELAAYSGDREALYKIALAALDETHILAVAIYDADGLPIANTGIPPPRLNPLPLPEQQALLDSDENSLLVTAPIIFHRRDNTPDSAISSRFEPATKAQSGQSSTLGWVTLQISRTTTLQRKREAIFFALLSSFAVLVLAGLLALVLGRQVTRPILRLQEAITKMQAGHLDARVSNSSSGDLQSLEEGLNSMAEALRENRELLQMKITAATHELEEKKNEAERASIAKSRFLAAASHDLRQPLHALSLFAADLGHEAVTPAQQRLSRQIKESVTGIAGLLDTLLDISRLDLAEVTPQKMLLPLGDIFGRIESSFVRLARSKGLRFRCRPTRLWMITDAVLFERLLGNLVANAIAYTPTGSVLIAARRHGDQVRVEVRDSGVGIAQEYRDAVFQEFFQVENAGRIQGRGLGLGLAIVSRIARILGLNVDLRSVPGKGSVFSVTLPLVTSMIGLPHAMPLAPSRLALLLPQTPVLEEAASLATRWGMDVIWIKSFAELRSEVGASAEEDPEPTITVELLERFEAMALHDLSTRINNLILLGNTENDWPDGAHVLSLPLRPAKLRALLNELFSATR